MEIEKKQEDLKRRQAESKIDINSITFDTGGKILLKKKLNINKLPNIGKSVDPKYSNSQGSWVKSSFGDFKKRLKEQKEERDMIRGLKIK